MMGGYDAYKKSKKRGRGIKSKTRTVSRRRSVKRSMKRSRSVKRK